MNRLSGVPQNAAISIEDLLNCAGVQPGQDVLLLAHIDGLAGGDNLVDRGAIEWIRESVKMRGANPSILWIEESDRTYSLGRSRMIILDEDGVDSGERLRVRRESTTATQSFR